MQILHKIFGYHNLSLKFYSSSLLPSSFILPSANKIEESNNKIKTADITKHLVIGNTRIGFWTLLFYEKSSHSRQKT